MAFNPDDFQFESITPPEQHKPILEWNALTRLMVVRVKDSDGTYSYHASKISAEVNENLLAGIPDEWSNENDRIVDFSIYEDGSYILDKEKLKFDFTTKTTKRIRYNYGEMSDAQITELFNILKAAIEVQRIDTEVERSREIISLAKNREYLTLLDKERQDIKTRLMNKSDWSQLADATETFDGELELWTTYRSYLRDNVRTPDDFEDLLDYLVWDAGFKWPLTPHEYHASDPEHATEYLSSLTHFKKSVEGTGRFAVEAVHGDVEKAALYEQAKAENGGIPISRQIYDKIAQYKLNTGLNNVDLDSLNITGA